MMPKGFTQINLLIPSFFCCLFSPYPHFSSASIKPPDSQANGARDLGQGPHPPLYHLNTHTRHPDHLYTTPRENRDNPQTLLLNGLQNPNTHNGRPHTNRLLHNSIQNTNSNPHNGIDNPAFTHTDAQNTNALPNTQQQNPNIVIQAGPAQGGAQPQAVHVSLNTLPPTEQQNSNAQMPTIHVNLNSYSTNGQPTQQESSSPLTRTTNNNALQSQQNLIHAGQSNPRMQRGQSYHSDPQLNGHEDQPGLISTGYTHYSTGNTFQRNANTQTHQQEPEPHRRSDRNSGNHDTAASSSRRQMPWDRLRGTPAYPTGTLQGGETSPEFSSSMTDYTTNPPMREERTTYRTQPQPHSLTTSRSRAPPGQDAPSVDRRTRSHSVDLLDPNTRSVAQLEAAHQTQRSPHSQRESAQRDIRGSPGRQIAPRQEATHSSNPQARSLMSQQASVGRSAVSQGPVTQQGPTALQGADTRALSDPNHLPIAHIAQQHRAAPIQKPPQGLDTQTVISGAKQPRQGGTAPVPFSPAQPNPSNLTQTALKAHTESTQTFQNRKQQTQAALLHPGPQTKAPAAEAQHPPIPPPVIPLAQFHSLPKKRTQHKSPARGPQPPRPPVNIPVAQRHLRVQERPHVQRHPATMPTDSRQHPQNGHMHVSAHRPAHAHARGHGHPAHFTHPQQVSEPLHDTVSHMFVNVADYRFTAHCFAIRLLLPAPSTQQCVLLFAVYIL